MTGAICLGASRNLTRHLFLNLSPTVLCLYCYNWLAQTKPASVAWCLKLAEIVAVKQTHISRWRSRPVAILSCLLMLGTKQECWPFNNVFFLLFLLLLKPKQNKEPFPRKAGGNSRRAWSTNIAWHIEAEAEVSLQCLVLRNGTVLIHVSMGPVKTTCHT